MQGAPSGRMEQRVEEVVVDDKWIYPREIEEQCSIITQGKQEKYKFKKYTRTIVDNIKLS